jgi:hypothetical protein
VWVDRRRHSGSPQQPLALAVGNSAWQVCVCVFLIYLQLVLEFPEWGRYGNNRLWHIAPDTHIWSSPLWTYTQPLIPLSHTTGGQSYHSMCRGGNWPLLSTHKGLHLAQFSVKLHSLLMKAVVPSRGRKQEAQFTYDCWNTWKRTWIAGSEMRPIDAAASSPFPGAARCLTCKVKLQ